MKNTRTAVRPTNLMVLAVIISVFMGWNLLLPGSAAASYSLGLTNGTGTSGPSSNAVSRAWLITTPNRVNMQVIGANMRGRSTGNFRVGIYASNAVNAQLQADFGQMSYTGPTGSYMATPAPATAPYYHLPVNTSICMAWKNNSGSGYAYATQNPTGITGNINGFDSSGTASAFVNPLPSNSSNSYYLQYYLVYDVYPTIASVSPNTGLTNGQTGVVINGGGFENQNEFGAGTSFVYLATGSTWAAKGTTVAQTVTNWPTDNLGTNNNITFTVAQGSLASGSTAYLYVVNSDGEANASGIPVTLAGASNGTTTGAITTSSVTDTSFNVSVAYTNDSNNNNSCAITVAGGTVSTPTVNRTSKTWTASVIGLTAGTAYTVSANFTDADGVTGTNPVTRSQTTTNSKTVVGALTSTGITSSSISVQAAYTGDSNANNSCVIQYRTDPSGTWNSLTTTKGSGVYTATASGLAPSTGYDFQATFTDADGITGTNPATLTNVVTSAASPTVWLSNPGNASMDTVSNQTYSVVFYNPGSSAITVTQVDISNNETASGVGWGSVVTPSGPSGSWTMLNLTDIQWTGSVSVPAHSAQSFYVTVTGSGPVPSSEHLINLTATVQATGGPYTSATNQMYSSRDSYSTVINGYLATSTADSHASPLYLLTNSGSPYAGGANVNFIYQLWASGNGVKNMYIVSNCGGGAQVKITLPAGWGQPTGFTVPSIFNTPVVTGSVSTGWTITATQNAATANYLSSQLYNAIQFSATAPTNYTVATASPVTATYGGVNATTDYVESGSTSGCGATNNYYTPVNVINNMAVMVASGAVNSTTTGAMTATSVSDSAVAVQATYTNDGNANNSCVIAYSTSASGPWTNLTTTKGSGLYTATASGLAVGTTYYFQATFTDADTVTGTNPLTLTQATTNNGTTTGAMSATATADTSIAVQATYTRDPNANNTCVIAYSTSASGPWTGLTTTKGTGLYSATASGLAAGTTYYFQATFTDADGIVGTNPLTLTSATTNNGTTTGTMSATTTADTSIAVQATFTRDANANNTCAIAYSTSASGPWTGLTTTKGSGLYSATASGLAAGTTYYFQATFTDANGVVGTNPLTLTQATTNNGTTTGAMSATTTTDTSVAVQATFTRDTNANNTCAIAYSTSASGPWTGLTTTKGSGLYSATASGLTAGTTYYFQATFTDADGIVGTNPLTLTQATTNNGTTTGALTATTVTTTSIATQATFTRDANANNTCAIAYSTSASGPWTGLTTTKGSGLYTATASGLTASTTYYFQATFTDANGVVGTNPLTLTQATAAANAVVVGTGSATVNSSTQITASATFTGDANGNSSTAFAYGPSATGPWTTSCATVTGASPRTCVISGLTAGSTYYIQVTDTDADGVTGTNPQVAGPYTTPINSLTVGTDSATVNSPTQITASATFTGDANGNSSTKFAYGTTVSGPWTTSCATVTGASPRTCAISGLTAGTTYYIQVTHTDADGVTGTNPQVIGPYTTPVNTLTLGTDSATVNSTTQITASAAFTGDANGNSTTAFAYGTSATGPWTTSCASVTGASPRTCAISGLTAGTAYYIQVTQTDADGVTGTNPQVIGPYTTLMNNLVVGTNSAVVNSGTQITATATFTGDANGNSTTAFAYGTSGSGPWTTSCATVSGSSPRTCVISGLTTGNSYYIQLTHTDADGVTGTNPQVIGPFVTSVIVCDSSVSNCMDCHSLPPAAGSHLVAEHKGDASRNACAVCHYNYKSMTNVTSTARWTTSHTNNYLDIYTSSNINGGIKGGYYSGYRNRSSLWAGGVANSNNTCSNTYCHGTTPSPIWGTTGSITCTSCHDAPPTAGSHSTHSSGYIGYADNSNAANYNFGCFKCHPQGQHTQGPATANSSAFVAFSNTSSPVSLGGTYTVGVAQGNDTRGYKWSNASCSNALYCHSNGRGGNANVTPVWGSTTPNCTNCHGNAAAKASVTLGGSHPTHVGTDTYSFNCSQCHNKTVSSGSSAISNKALHVNGVKDVYFALYNNMTGSYSGSPSGSCRNVYCHSDGNGGAPNVTPQWGVTAITCGSCHNYKAPTAMASGQHTYHTNTPNIGTFGCVQCHNRTVNGSDQIQYANGKHVNGVKDVYFSVFNGYSGSYNSGTKTCSNVYCHSSGQSTPTFRTVAAWSSVTTYNCKSCHGADTGTGTVTSQFGEPNYANVSTASRAQYNGHGVAGHVGAASDCSKCHYGTATVNVVGGFANITSGGKHVNGTRDINFRSDITGTYDPVRKQCTDVSCHGGVGSGTFRWGGTGTCQACHLKTGNDVNDFVYNNGTRATISLEDWTSAGHGKKSGKYFYTQNAAANKVCTDCHSNGVSHGDARNPFRLISSATTRPTSPDTLCNSCHTEAVHDFSHVGIGTWSFTPKCIDCHDPHGDKGGVTTTEFNGAMIQSLVNYTTASSAYGVPGATQPVDWPANFARAKKLPAAPYYNWSSFVSNSGANKGICRVCHNNSVQHFSKTLYDAPSGHNHGQACVNCHSHTAGFKPAGGDCKACHISGGTPTTNGRRDIQGDFSKKSHHINASWASISTRSCAMCHAEANPDGSQNTTYHQSGKAVVLNVWNGAFNSYTGISGLTRTFVRYTTGDGASAGLPVSPAANLNPVCLNCHNRANANSTPYKASGDLNKPTVYDVWDNATSIEAMYNNSGTTVFSKYSPVTNNVVPQIVKAYSPHGNPTVNQRGKAKYGPWVNDTAAAGSKVACFDCHNSHGSSVGSNPANTLPLTSYSSTYSGTKGGLFKEYAPTNASSTNQTTYMPTQGGTTAPYSASSALCFDCHLGDNASAPKNYKTPFGLKSTIDGYYDAGRWQGTDVWKGSFAYKTAQASGNGNGSQKGGHFGASSPLLYSTTKTINGRCVMCHDPHGVAQNANKAYMVPSLRGTWMTSPYKEDRVASQSGVADSNKYGSYWQSKKAFKPARMNPRFNYNDPPYVGGGYGTGINAGTNWDTGGTGADGYFIDDNTFGTNRTNGSGANRAVFDNATGNKAHGAVTANHISEDTTKFAGLCLGCHSATNLQALSYTNATTTWKPHNAVAGWGAATDDVFLPRDASEHNMSFSSTTPRTGQDMRCDYIGQGYVPYVMPSGYRWSVTPGTISLTKSTATSVPPTATAGTQSTPGYVQNQFHAFPCAKCHTPHTSKLPRLMKTNCLDVGALTTPKHNTGYTYPICNTGSATGSTGNMKYNMTQCHNIKRTNTLHGGGWNTKTGW